MAFLKESISISSFLVIVTPFFDCQRFVEQLKDAGYDDGQELVDLFEK